MIVSSVECLLPNSAKYNLLQLLGRYSAAELPKLVAQIHRMTSQASSLRATPPASLQGDVPAARQPSRFQKETLAVREEALNEGVQPAQPVAEDAQWVPDNPEGAALLASNSASLLTASLIAILKAKLDVSSFEDCALESS